MGRINLNYENYGFDGKPNYSCSVRTDSGVATYYLSDWSSRLENFLRFYQIKSFLRKCSGERVSFEVSCLSGEDARKIDPKLSEIRRLIMKHNNKTSRAA
jgi:hypothetical protein